MIIQRKLFQGHFGLGRELVVFCMIIVGSLSDLFGPKTGMIFNYVTLHTLLGWEFGQKL